MIRSFTLVIASLLLLSACQTKQHADLILHHGKVYTVDSAFTSAEAFAVKEGRIIAIGSNKDVLGKYTSDSSIDAKGGVVYLYRFTDATGTKATLERASVTFMKGA